MKDKLLTDLIVGVGGPSARPLRTRTLNALAVAGYKTALAVCRLHRNELAAVPGVGKKAAYDLAETLNDLGFLLRPDPLAPLDSRHATVIEDWTADVPVKDTAAKLGVSSARICQLRPQARRDHFDRKRRGDHVAVWKAQFTGTLFKAEANDEAE